MHNNTSVAKVNKKGQIVIPSEFRKKLGIGIDSFIEIRLLPENITISPIDSFLTTTSTENSYIHLLQETKGKWGNVSDSTNNKLNELNHAEKLRNTQW